MGIKNLKKVLAENAPNSIKTGDIKNYFGRKVVIDASMSIYQFLIAIRQEENTLTNDEGEATSHLMGIFYRTIRMMVNGLKPIYVFDGKPPEMKSDELVKRGERREEAEKALESAKALEDAEQIEKFSKRLVKVTPKQNEECMRLLQLMGVPYFEAPGEAEAQCAAFVKAKLAYAVGTEDMDALTFGGSVLLRHLTFSEAKKLPIEEFHLAKILEELQFSMEQFVDLCILLGCDYCPGISGIGPKKAIELIRKHVSLERVVDSLKEGGGGGGGKYMVPPDWKFAEARQLFLHPNVASVNPSGENGDVGKDKKKDGEDTKEKGEEKQQDGEATSSNVGGGASSFCNFEPKWREPDEEGIVQFMCGENNFNEERIRNAVKKLSKAKNTAAQGRIDSYFSAIPGASPAANSNKRKSCEPVKSDSSKKKRGGGAFRRGK